MSNSTRKKSCLLENKENTPKKQRKPLENENCTPRRSSRIKTPTIKLRDSLVNNRKLRGSNIKFKFSDNENSDDDFDLQKCSKRSSTRKKNYNHDDNTSPKKKNKSSNKNDIKYTPGKLCNDLEQISIVSDEENVDASVQPCRKSLFGEEDVLGKKMFGFQTPKKRGSMVQKALEAVNSPLDTPTNRKSVVLPAKTPHAVRNKIKKELIALVEETASDFSDSGSEYKPISSSESDSELSTESDKDSKDVDDTVKLLGNLNVTNIVKKSRRDLTYIMKSDDYFVQASNKTLTSNHTLQRLKNPKLSEEQLEDLLSNTLSLSKNHELCINNLFQENTSYFHKWLSILNEGFSVVLYGLGSKHKILDLFNVNLKPLGFPVVVVNGYFPSLTIKDITDSILIDILEESECSNVFEAVNIIEEEFKSMPELHLYLIVNNIDGTMLRNAKSQNVLASLAAIQNIHLVASIDHINTPLIWDHSKLSKFNFTWWDTSLFLSYTDETSFESSLLVQRSGALTLSSLSSVYQSLTKNSRGVFMLIINYQLSNKNIKHYQGMPFKVLYSKSRENFLVSSDLALRAQLTEFLDHKLVKSRRSADGTEQLIIPINNSILQQFMEQQEGNEK